MSIPVSLNRKWLILMFLLQHAFVIGYVHAQSYKMDARESAQYVARSGVRTAYDNMLSNGIPWKTIRDQKLPDVLDRVIIGLKDRYSSKVLTNTYIPAFTRAFYDEVEKINSENHQGCLEQETLDIYYNAVVGACKTHLLIDVSVGVKDILTVGTNSCTPA